MKRAGTEPGTCLFMEKSSDSPTDFSAGPARAEAGPPAPRLPLTLPPPLPFWPWRILCPGVRDAPSHPFSFPNRPGRHAASLLPQMVAMTMALLLLLPRLASQSSSRMTAREEVRLPNSTGDLPMRRTRRAAPTRRTTTRSRRTIRVWPSIRPRVLSPRVGQYPRI